MKPEILRTKSANNEAVDQSVGEETEEIIDIVEIPAWLDEENKITEQAQPPEQGHVSEQETDDMSHAA